MEYRPIVFEGNFGIEVKGESAQNRAVRGVAAYEVIKQHRETSSEFLKNKEIFISDSEEAGVKASAAEREAVKKPNWSEAAALEIR